MTGAVGLRQPDGSHGPGGDAVFPLVRDLVWEHLFASVTELGVYGY
ncbi:hypothetical protein [Streptomyces zaomyceticus]